jgi:hypothetical protein
MHSSRIEEHRSASPHDTFESVGYTRRIIESLTHPALPQAQITYPINSPTTIPKKYPTRYILK